METGVWAGIGCPDVVESNFVDDVGTLLLAARVERCCAVRSDGTARSKRRRGFSSSLLVEAWQQVIQAVGDEMVLVEHTQGSHTSIRVNIRRLAGANLLGQTYTVTAVRSPIVA